ncbi:hypothetical protein GCM10022234_35890 [Aeromicrobium panaciterrae]
MSINNASVVNDYYNVLLDDGSHSDEWERWLSAVEGAAAPAVRRAIGSLIWWPTAQERHDISTWIAAQYLRSTAHRRSQAQHKSLIVAMQVGMGGIAYLRHTMEKGLRRRVTDDEVETIWADVTGSNAKWTVSALEHVTALGHTIESATRLVHDRGWHRVQFTRLSLAINDTPIALMPADDHPDFMGVGLANAGYITVALDRQTMLLMTAIGDQDFDLPPSTRLARTHNSTVMLNADRFVYSHPDDDSLPELPMPRPPRNTVSATGPDMINRDRPLDEVLAQIESHDYNDRATLIADYEWPLDGYVPPIELTPGDDPTGSEGS